MAVQSPGTSLVCQYHVFEGENSYPSLKVRDVEQNKSCFMELKQNYTENCTPLMMPLHTQWINGSAIKITLPLETANGTQFELSLVTGNYTSLRFHSCGFAINGEYPPYLLWMCDWQWRLLQLFAPVCSTWTDLLLTA
jgi:hypothetical protein